MRSIKAPPSIDEEGGTEAWLNNRISEHDGLGYDDFRRFIAAGTPKLVIARLFGKKSKQWTYDMIAHDKRRSEYEKAGQ